MAEPASDLPGLFDAARPSAAAGARPGRGRRPRAWFALLLLLAAAAVVAWGVSELGRGVEARSFARVDPRRVLLEPGQGWADPRWEEEIAWRLSRHPGFAADDSQAQLTLAAELARLPFVEEVGLPAALWPDGLQVALRLRRPVACVAQGEGFLLVSDDGRVLPGRWLAPPRIGAGFVPRLIGEPGREAELRPGGVLADPRLLDALAVANSMWRHLEARDLDSIGRACIDARTAPAASVEEPGVRILLEGRRAILFGRSADTRAPGELPTAEKWNSVSMGLAALRSGLADRNWVTLDVRWDVPEWELAPMGEGGDAEDGAQAPGGSADDPGERRGG